jgi:hypothetical protein
LDQRLVPGPAGLTQMFDAIDISWKETARTVKKVVDNVAAFLYFDRVKV